MLYLAHSLWGWWEWTEWRTLLVCTLQLVLVKEKYSKEEVWSIMLWINANQIKNWILVELWKHDVWSHLGVSHWWPDGLRAIEVNKIEDATSIHNSIDVRKSKNLQKRYGVSCCGLMPTTTSTTLCDSQFHHRITPNPNGWSYISPTWTWFLRRFDAWIHDVY